MTTFKFHVNGENSLKGYKTLQEKDKLLVMSNLCFSNNVINGHVLPTQQRACFGKG